MNESNKCCEKCNDMQGDQSCEDTTCPCHSPTDTRTSDVEIRIATIIADCKVAGTSANETTRQVLEALTSFREKIVAEERERIALDVKHRLALCGHACGATQELSELLQALTPPKETN